MLWVNQYDGGPHEANFLKLDCSLAKATFGWKPRWDVKTTMEYICQWTNIYMQQGDVVRETERQIQAFLEEV